MTDIAIRVENLSKRYQIGRAQQRHDTLRDALMVGLRTPLKRLRRNDRGSDGHTDDAIWALRDVSFEVKHGEVLGVIGHNAAGKSTLLKILSQITEPTTGRAKIYGRVGSLLEVGTGFHPELTGRENIYLNGAILGMKRTEINRKFDAIVAFAEIEKFLDTPVKRYSSGMYVRLAFAVAAHLEPDILLVDEVLAVGDAAFQKKCLGKMGEVAKEGRTVLFVSHSMAAVNSLCPRCLLLGQGQIVLDGEIEKVIQCYLSSNVHHGEVILDPDTPRGGSGKALYEKVRILNDQGEVTDSISMGDDLVVEMSFRCQQPVEHISFGVALRGSMQERILQCLSRVTHGDMPAARLGGTVRARIERINLVPGSYYVSVGMSRPGEQLDYLENLLRLDVIPQDVYKTGKTPHYGSALIYLPCRWEAEYS